MGSYLIQHPSVNTVLLTGGTATARRFLQLRPGLDLHAEAGGKNAIIVTAMSDRDQAIREIIQSAFGHAGQKCSACSLLILEREVFADTQFKKQLLDAAQSLIVGSAWNPHVKMTPLIRQPEGPLLRALTTLEEGESWLLEPKADPSNSQLWSCGIKWGVKKNSFMHQMELFGPVLGVMEANSLEEGVILANATPYGLTSGLFSLDEREQRYWKKNIVAGNLYINKGITGAIVKRQPFGGCKASQFGGGAKAGGPNYVAQLAHATQSKMPHQPSKISPPIYFERFLAPFKLTSDEETIWRKSIESYSYWAEILKTETPCSHLLGEANLFYLAPLEKIFLRLEKIPPTPLPLLQIVAASFLCGTPLEISSKMTLPYSLSLPQISSVVEGEDPFFEKNPSRIRLLAPPSDLLKQKAAIGGATLLAAPPLINGRFELLHYLREISLSVTTHRYGYIAKT